MTTQEIGTMLVVAGFIAWVAAWVGLTSYGVAWIVRDRTGALVSIFAGLVVFMAGVIALTNTPGGIG